jgi:hypothetical protein
VASTGRLMQRSKKFMRLLPVSATLWCQQLLQQTLSALGLKGNNY